MSRTFDQSRGLDEYGHYGENNPPIRDMTDEERQRAKEREKANKEGGYDD